MRDRGFTKGPPAQQTGEFNVQESQKLTIRFAEGSELAFLGAPTQTLLFMKHQPYHLNLMLKLLPTKNTQHCGELQFEKKDEVKAEDISIVMTVPTGNPNAANVINIAKYECQSIWIPIMQLHI